MAAKDVDITDDITEALALLDEITRLDGDADEIEALNAARTILRDTLV